MSGRGHRRSAPKRAAERTLDQIEVRFVYEDGIKGEWITLTNAFMNTFIVPNRTLEVKRVDFQVIDQTRGGTI